MRARVWAWIFPTPTAAVGHVPMPMISKLFLVAAAIALMLTIQGCNPNEASCETEGAKVCCEATGRKGSTGSISVVKACCEGSVVQTCADSYQDGDLCAADFQQKIVSCCANPRNPCTNETATVEECVKLEVEEDSGNLGVGC